MKTAVRAGGQRITLMAFVCIAALAHSADFTVAPNGSDQDAGTAVKPFASLTRARDAVRELKKDGMTRDVVVEIRAGEYLLDEPVVFGPQDSGTDGFRVIYKNAEALGSARFVGSERITGWVRHQGNVWKKMGIGTPVTTLYEDGQWADIARIPNREIDPKYPNALAPYFVSTGGGSKTITYAAGAIDPTGWTIKEGAEVIWWGRAGKPDWGQGTAKLRSVEPEKRTLNVRQPGGGKSSYWKTQRGDRFYIQGVKELLDAPGEYFYEQESETLFYIPRGEDPNLADIRTPKTIRLIEVKGPDRKGIVRNITFSGLGFEFAAFGGQDGAVNLTYCQHVVIEKCRFRHIGSFAVYGHEGVSHCSVLNCLIEKMGRGGILINNRFVKRTAKPDVRSEFNRVYNCRIHDLGVARVDACLNGGVMLWSANDCRVSHCDIARSTRYGISLRGHWSSQRGEGKQDNGSHLTKDNVFQYIRITDVGSDSGDMGAVHAAHLNEPDGTCINTWRQIIVRGVHAHPSMKDYAPNGIFVDHPRSCQKQVFEDIDIADTQGKPWRDNRNPVQTFRNVSFKPEFDRTRIQTDRIGLTPEFPKEYGGQGLVDRLPPSPQMPQWAGPGKALSGSAVQVEVAPCTDDMGGVEYLFECLTEGGHGSGWQVDPIHADRRLKPETEYRYRVKARDTSGARNETAWSEVLTVRTAMDATAPKAPSVAVYTFEGSGNDVTGEHDGRFSRGADLSDDAAVGKKAFTCGKSHLSVRDHPNLDIGQSDFALSLWFQRYPSPKGNLRLLSKYDSKWNGYCIRGGDTSILFEMGEGKTRPAVSGKLKALRKWHHLIVNIDREDAMTLYLDGEKVGAKDISSFKGMNINSSAPLCIGSGSNLPWSGMVDDVRIWKRLLTDDEIRQLADGSVPGAQ